MIPLKETEKPLVSDDKRVEIIMLVIENDRDVAIKSIEGILKTKYPFKLTIYENSLNTRNTSKIWNKLIRQSTCGYVMLIDSDAFPQNEKWLDEMVKVLEQHPDAAVVGPICPPGGVTTAQTRVSSWEGAVITDGHISGYCMLFKKKIFEEYRYFDEDFMFFGQESDWQEEILEKQKYKIFIASAAIVHHGIGGEPSTSSKRLEKEGKFDYKSDSEYSRSLFEYKKQQRKEKEKHE